MAHVAELKRKIYLCEKYKKKLSDFLHNLKEKYLSKKISYSEYERKLYEKKQGKNVLEWIEYYDSYIEYCKKEIKRQEKVSKRQILTFSLASLFFLFLILSVFYFSPYLISLATKDVSYSQEKFDENIFSVIITGSHKNIEYIRHCWSSNGKCELGILNASTCVLEDNSCEVEQTQQGIWNLCSKYKHDNIWTNTECTVYDTSAFVKPKEIIQEPIIEEPIEEIPGAIYGLYSITVCNNGVCNQKIYNQQIAIKNKDGIYRPFREIVKIDTSDNLLKISWNDKQVIFSPYVEYKNNKHEVKIPGKASKLPEIPQEIPLTHKYKSKQFSYKYDIEIPYLSSNVSKDVSKVGLGIVDVQGFNENEIKFSDKKILLPDNIVFSWDDAAKEFGDNNVKTTAKGIEVLNLKNKQKIIIDPTISLIALDDVSVTSMEIATGNNVFRSYLKFPISSIPVNAVISQADFVFYVISVTGTPALTNFYNCSSIWQEDSDPSSILLPLPCTQSGIQNIRLTGLKIQDTLKQVNDSYNSGGRNLSIAMNTSALYVEGIFSPPDGTAVTLQVGSVISAVDNSYLVNSSEAATNQPYLNVTYTADTTGPTIVYITPTPANASHNQVTTIYINATVFDTTNYVSACILTWNNTNYTMTLQSIITPSANVTCNYTLNNLLSSRYDYKILANDSLNNWNQTNTRELLVTAISNCTRIDYPGNYIMLYDINDVTTTGSCINITANNVTLDCQSHLIDGNNVVDNGININRPTNQFGNITIQNCKVTEWDTYGIYLYNANNSTLKNLNVSSNADEGIYSYNSHGSLFTNITASGNGDNGLKIASYFNKVVNSTFTSNTFSGIYMVYADYCNITNITTAYNTQYGLNVQDSDYGSITNSRIIGNTLGGFYSNLTGEGGAIYIYNNFFNNTINYASTGIIYINNWNTTQQAGMRIYSDGTDIGGNYWENSSADGGYSETCADANTDGFCDIALNLTSDGKNPDYLPLSNKYGANVAPFIGNASINETSILLNEWVCLNATAHDPDGDAITVTATVWNTTNFVNYTLVDSGAIGSIWCAGSLFDNIYGVEVQGLKTGTWNFSHAIANDSSSFNTTIVNRRWNVTAPKYVPRIIYVSPIDATNPNESGIRNITFSTHVYDIDGVDNINQTGTTANFSYPGETTRTSGTCGYVGDVDTETSNFSCSIEMWYWDAPGNWNISVHAQDLDGGEAFNISTFFQYNQLEAIVLSPYAINFGTLFSGTRNQTAIDDPTYINNTGNANITNITVMGIHLYGEDNSTYFINAANFSVNISTGTPPPECDGTNLQNGTDIQILGATLIRGNLSLNDGTGQEQIYYCLKQVPQLPSQVYSTTLKGSWFIKIVALVAVIRIRKRRSRVKRRKKRELEDNIPKIIQEFGKLKAKYKLSKEELIKVITKEIEIPITIFSKELGALESVVKYMKENLGMSYAEIAQLLIRDERTIWTSYKKAIEKQKQKIKEKKTDMLLPISIFKDRRLTILESIILHLKEKQYKYSEIADLLERDQRNIYTIHSRAVRKTKGKL